MSSFDFVYYSVTLGTNGLAVAWSNNASSNTVPLRFGVPAIDGKDAHAIALDPPPTNIDFHTFSLGIRYPAPGDTWALRYDSVVCDVLP